MQQPVLPLSESCPMERVGYAFPPVGLDAIGDRLIGDIQGSWSLYPPAPGCHSGGAARNSRVLVAGGASGTGKTRFGAVLPQVLLAAARRMPAAPPALIQALDECAARQLVLQANVSTTQIDLASLVLAAYLQPPATASSPRFRQAAVPFNLPLRQAFTLIAQSERAWRPYAGPISVIIHLDEVQELLKGQPKISEREAGQFLGKLVRQMAEVLWDDQSISLFPIFYVSGLSKTLVLNTDSFDPVVEVDLPLLRVPHYADILRPLFGLSDSWMPPAPVARALRCLEGPPRLLLLFLWALGRDQDTRAGKGQLGKGIFGHPLDCSLISALLCHMGWDQSAVALNRCMDALESGRLFTFTDRVLNQADRQRLFHCIASLVLLSQPIALGAQLDSIMTVNEAIKEGCVFAQRVDEKSCSLHWPRMYC